MMARVAAIALAGALGLSGLALAATLHQQDGDGLTVVTSTESPSPADLTAIADDSWMDIPITAGNWFYEAESSETLAIFGASAFEPLVMLRCDLESRQVGLAVASDTAEPTRLVIRTETQDLAVLAQPLERRQPLLVTEFAAFNDILDAIAFSRGRFAVEIEGEETLAIPAWPEITRVIEDCR